MIFGFVILLFIAALGYLLVQLAPVQRWATQSVTTFLSSELERKVTLESVKLRLPGTIILNGLYLEDHHRDTLLHISSLNVRLYRLNLAKRKIRISRADLIGTTFKVRKYKGEQHDNLYPVIRYFISDDSTSQSDPFRLRLDALRITGSAFSYHNDNQINNKLMVDFNHISLTGFHADLKDISVIRDTIDFNAKSIGFRESSGFILNRLSTQGRIHSSAMFYENISIRTPSTDLKGRLDFTYDSMRDFDDFVHKVRIQSTFTDTRIASNDIAYFTSDLKGLNRTVNFNGEIKGRIDQLKGRKLKILYGNNTKFEGNLSLTGLPDINNTFIDLLVDKFHTSVNDVRTIPVMPFGNQRMIQLSPALIRVHTLDFNGKFTGFISDFVAYGNISSPLGRVTSDINVKNTPGKSISEYSGKLSAFNLDAGTLFNITKTLGLVSFNADIKGSGFTLDDLNARLNGNFSNFSAMGYDYKNIVVDANIAKGLFKGALRVLEENLDLDFDGQIDFTGTKPVFDFEANIQNAFLAKLKLLKRDPSSRLSTKVKIDLTGMKIDEIEGSLKLTGTQFSEKGKNYEIKVFELISAGAKKNKTISVNSDLLTVSLNGDFDLASLPLSLQGYFSQVLPAFIPVPSKTVSEQSLKFSAGIFDFNPISDLFLPEITLEKNTVISGEIDLKKSLLKFSANTAKARYRKIEFGDVVINVNNTFNREVDLSFQSRTLQFNDSLIFENLVVSATTEQGLINYGVRLADSLSSNLSADLSGKARFPEPEKILLQWQPSSIYVNGKGWFLNPSGSVIIHNQELNFSNLYLEHENQKIAISGNYDFTKDFNLKTSFSNFELLNLKPVLELADIRASGSMNGTASLFKEKGNQMLISDAVITDFVFNGDSLGTLNLNSGWVNETGVVSVDASISKSTLKNVIFKGLYDTKKDDNNIAFDIAVDKVNLGVLEPFLQGTLTEMRGILSGKFTLKGSLKKPELSGKAMLQKAGFKVDYLNTNYTFADEITLEKNKLIFHNITLYDYPKGNTAIVNGEIRHTHFKDWDFDLAIQANNLMMLNTKAEHNSLYYGTAYGRGLVLIRGDLAKLQMNISAVTEKGTQIFIPLSNPEEIKTNDFISFISKDTVSSKLTSKEIDLSRIEMLFDLTVTPDAEIQLLFDPKIGDIIKGSGNGNLKMEINTKGDFNMYGTMVSESGEYLFTLQNVINKRFKLEKGGTISWSGDVYDARVDLSAVYKIRTSLYDLLQDTVSVTKKRVPVEIKLNMANKLMNPNVTFDIEIPNIDQDIQNQVKKYINTDQEMNRQVFSLLLLNRFATPTQLAGSFQQGNSAVSANATELLSNQLSNWASQISSAVDIGVNYRAGNAFTKEELELGLSTQLFNDRVLLDGNVGVANDQNTSNIAGDFNVEVKLSEDGKFRIKAFNRSNNTSLIGSNSLYKQGVGLFYRQEFDEVADLINRIRKKKALTTEVPELIP